MRRRLGTGTGAGGGRGTASGAEASVAGAALGGAVTSGSGCGVACGAGAGSGGGAGTGGGVASCAGGVVSGAGGATSCVGGTTVGGWISAGGAIGRGWVCSTGGAGGGGGGSDACGAGEACRFGDTGAGLAIEGGVLPPPSNTIATEAGGTACGGVRLCCAATIATASKARCSRTDRTTGHPMRRRGGARGSRTADDAARGVMAAVMALMGVRRTCGNRSCGDTMPSGCGEKGRQYLQSVTRRPQGPGRGTLLNLPV